MAALSSAAVLAPSSLDFPVSVSGEEQWSSQRSPLLQYYQVILSCYHLTIWQHSPLLQFSEFSSLWHQVRSSGAASAPSTPACSSAGRTPASAVNARRPA